MKIGLLGIGTIGTGVYEQLAGRNDISVKKILERRDIPHLADMIVRNFDDILNDPEIDTVVELMGGVHPAYDFALSALKAGKNIVTANKLMLSYHLEDLLAASAESGAQLRIDASVGGSIPYLYNLMRATRANDISSVYGIVNGTTNLILDTMQTSGADFADVLAQAQAAGFAEADPTADIDGIDARSKLCISASLAFGSYVHPDDVAMEGIRHITAADVKQFKKLGLVCRLIARADLAENGVCASVEPTLLGADEPETLVHRGDNLITMIGSYSGKHSFFGQGAGKDPTAFNVILGLTDILNGAVPMHKVAPSGRANVNNSALSRRYYLRTSAKVDVAGEKLDEGVYLTNPMTVQQMHSLAAELRAEDPALFFAGVRE